MKRIFSCSSNNIEIGVAENSAPKNIVQLSHCQFCSAPILNVIGAEPATFFNQEHNPIKYYELYNNEEAFPRTLNTKDSCDSVKINNGDSKKPFVEVKSTPVSSRHPSPLYNNTKVWLPSPAPEKWTHRIPIPQVNDNYHTHLSLKPNLSWSPDKHEEDASFRPRLHSEVPYFSRLSRSTRVRKWVQGRHRKKQSDHKKLTRSTCYRRRKKILSPSVAASNLSLEADINEKYLKNITDANHSYRYSKERRINALKDKLTSKEQSCEILDFLGNREFCAALKLMKESNSRVISEVCVLWSCLYGIAELVKTFIANGANPEARDAEGYSCLHLICESGSLEAFDVLWKKGVRITGSSIWDFKGEMTPLMVAARNGFGDLIKRLISAGVDVDAGLHSRTKTALHYACKADNIEVVQILLDAKATLNPLLLYSETPLHIAVEEGFSSLVEFLLSAGANVHACRGTSKTTCLHIAAQNSYFLIANQLLKSGAEANQEDVRGRTALHLATKAQCYDTVQVLLNYGANPNAIDVDGKTPLHTGIFKGSRSFECLKLLLENGANPNIADNAGYTPLHLAALHDSTYCVLLFLKNGSDMTKCTKGGVSVLNIILRRTPTVISHIQESLNNSITFVEHDKLYERDGQVQLDFKVLLPEEENEPEFKLLSAFIKEKQNHLLKHPLCETFLHLKWIRIRSFFIFNVAFYALLVLLITEYIYIVFIGTAENNLEHKYKNRTNTSYLSIPSWYEFKCSKIVPGVADNILSYFIWFFLFFLTLKETFQLMDGPKAYVSSLDNILVWPVIIGSFTVTISNIYCRELCPWEYHVAAFVILFSWLELLLLIGRFPIFGIYVHMFSKVTKNFGKFVITYICLIYAFSLSFGILFHNQEPFKRRLLRILKTLVMMTGEIDYNEWFFEYRKHERMLYNGTSHVVFAMFLLFGTIILMNLLVGLAVSDIQGLQKSAGLDRLARQTELISQFELFMFSRWLEFVVPKGLMTFFHKRILLVNSTRAGVVIVNLKNSVVKIPEDVLENIKRVAKNRDHLSRRKNAFMNFRSLSSNFQVTMDTDADIARGLDAVRCGLDVLLWDNQDHNDEAVNITNMLGNITSLIQDLSDKVISTKNTLGSVSPLTSDISTDN